MRPNPWLPPLARSGPPPEADVALVCLPSAAGSAQQFRPWRTAFPEHVSVRPVELPGHGRRMLEPPIDDLRALAVGAAEAVREQIGGQLVLFGHSFGALLAFEVAQELQGQGRPVARLIVAAFPAPDRIGARLDPAGIPDEALIRFLPDEVATVLANHELRSAVLGGLRADLAAIAGYRHQPGRPLTCTITAYTGTRDDIAPDDIEAWGRHTAAGFSSHEVEGDHFFLRSEGFLRHLAAEVDQLTLGMTARPAAE